MEAMSNENEKELSSEMEMKKLEYIQDVKK